MSKQAWLGSLLLFALGSSARPAAAFCQATTCDPVTARCATDARNCLAEGSPLAWASSCITVSVQADGAPKQHIDYSAAEGSVERAFAAWTSAPCEGGRPSIAVHVDGPITCDASEYNSDRGNANIVVFREDSWPYTGGQDALGLTRIRFDPDTGAIYDSDIEVNAVDEPLSVGDPVPGSVDLDSLLTHEAGHLLGLAHNTLDKTATMFPGYQPGSIELRSLAADDIAGICAIYPHARQVSSTSCEPRHGYADLCGAQQPAPSPDVQSAATSDGCSASAKRPRSALALALASALGALALLRTRRRRSR
ncbi:MAG: matrixin family metalloprotease [Polyangiaceae bacterium]